MALGETYYHLRPTADRPDSIAGAWFWVAADADSGFAPARLHLAEAAFRQGHLDLGSRWLAELEHLEPNSPHLQRLRLMRDCVSGKVDKAGWERAALAGPSDVFGAAKELSGAAFQVPCAETAWRALLRSAPDSVSLAWGAFLTLHGLLMATGREQEALVLIDSAAAAGQEAALALAVLDLLAGAPAETQAGRVEETFRRAYGDSFSGVSSTGRWLLSLYYYHLGNATAVRVQADSMKSRLDRGGSALDTMIAAATTAHAALVGGDSVVALTLLRSLRSIGRRDALLWGFSEALAPERLLLARLELAQGRPAEALAVAAVFDHPQPVTFLIYLGESLRIRKLAAARLRQRDAERGYGSRLEAFRD
jgi:hypothetical protein